VLGSLRRDDPIVISLCIPWLFPDVVGPSSAKRTLLSRCARAPSPTVRRPPERSSLTCFRVASGRSTVTYNTTDHSSQFRFFRGMMARSCEAGNMPDLPERHQEYTVVHSLTADKGDCCCLSELPHFAHGRICYPVSRPICDDILNNSCTRDNKLDIPVHCQGFYPSRSTLTKQVSATVATLEFDELVDGAKVHVLPAFWFPSSSRNPEMLRLFMLTDQIKSSTWSRRR
jgi:hypothetical protein